MSELIIAQRIGSILDGLDPTDNTDAGTILRSLAWAHRSSQWGPVRNNIATYARAWITYTDIEWILPLPSDVQMLFLEDIAKLAYATSIDGSNTSTLLLHADILTLYQHYVQNGEIGLAEMLILTIYDRNVLNALMWLDYRPFLQGKAVEHSYLVNEIAGDSTSSNKTEFDNDIEEVIHLTYDRDIPLFINHYISRSGIWTTYIDSGVPTTPTDDSDIGRHGIEIIHSDLYG